MPSPPSLLQSILLGVRLDYISPSEDAHPDGVMKQTSCAGPAGEQAVQGNGLPVRSAGLFTITGKTPRTYRLVDGCHTQNSSIMA